MIHVVTDFFFFSLSAILFFALMTSYHKVMVIWQVCCMHCWFRFASSCSSWVCRLSCMPQLDAVATSSLQLRTQSCRCWSQIMLHQENPWLGCFLSSWRKQSALISKVKRCLLTVWQSYAHPGFTKSRVSVWGLLIAWNSFKPGVTPDRIKAVGTRRCSPAHR